MISPLESCVGSSHNRFMRAWVLTDGNSGDEEICLAVAEAAADRIERRRVAPRAPWRWLVPFGPIDPRDAPEQGAGPIAPKRGQTWPDLVVGAGRRAAPYLVRLKAASGGRTATVFLGPSMAGAGIADLVWVSEQDRLRGSNVIVTPTRPHRIGPIRLAAARGGPALVPAEVKGKRVAALLGGDLSWRRADDEDCDRLIAGLARLCADGAVLLASLSDRTPERLAMAVRRLAHYVWEGTGDNPYISLLAQSEAFVVMSDSPNMIGQALTTGAPVMVFETSGRRRGTRAFLDRLMALGAVRPFAGRIERCGGQQLDAAAEIARAIQALVATRAALSRDVSRKKPAPTRETNGRPSR
jgi:mitochondrial fission protein ELM1